MITLNMTDEQAEVLYCILRLPVNHHYYYNHNNGLTFTVEENQEELEPDLIETDKARTELAMILYPLLPENVREQHNVSIELDQDILDPGIGSSTRP